MPTPNTQPNGTLQHWVTVRPEPVGQFTAEALGLPGICATAATRAEAVTRVQELLRCLVASQQLMAIDVQTEKPLLNGSRPKDPNNPNEKAYLDALARDRQEDLEQTLRELDQECSGSSSTPTI